MPEQFTFEEATEPETFSFEDVQEKPEVSGPPPESTPFPGPYGVPMGAWEQPLVKIPPKVTETGLRALMYGPPNLSQLLWLAPKEKREQIIKGVSESLAGQASSLSSPGGLGMVAGAAVAPEIFIPAMVGYGETQLPGAIEEVDKAKTTEEKAKAWMDLAGTAGMVLGPVMPGAKAKPKSKAAEAPKAPPVEPPEVQETIKAAAAVLPEAAKEAEKPSKTLEDIVGEHNRKVDAAVEANLKAAGTEGGVELQSTEWPDVKMLITPDISEPGKWRATRIDKHGPVGHQVFDSREAAIRAYSGESFTDMVKGPSYTKPGAYVFSRIVKTEKPAAPAAEPETHETVLSKEREVDKIPKVSETKAQSLVDKATEAEKRYYRATLALERAEQQKSPESVLEPLRIEVVRLEKEAIAAEEAAQPKEPNAIPEQSPDEVSIQPTPGSSGTVGEGVRPPVEEAPGAKAEAPAEALNPTQMAEAVGGVKFDAEIDYKLPGKPPMWQFTLTTKGRESTIYVPKGTTVEELRAKVAAKNAEYDAAETAPKAKDSISSLDVREGDKIYWEPNERERRYQSPVQGIVQDVIHNTEGDVGFNIFSPTKDDPTNVVRVWANRGKVVSRTPKPVEESGGASVLGMGESASGKKIGSEVGTGRTPNRPKSIVEIADEIAAKGVDPQASYGLFVKARNLRPEISAKEWLPIYKTSLKLARLKPKEAAPPSVDPRGAEKPAASSTLAASSVTPVAGGERASSAAARQGEVGTGSATSQATVGWSVFQNGEPYGHFKNERQARMAASGLSGNVEVRPVTAADISEVKRLQEQEKFQTTPEIKAVPAPDVRDVVSMAAQLAKRKDIPAVKKTRLGPLIETARQGNPQPLQAEVERLQRAYPRTVEPKAIRRLFDRETEAVGTDILDWISDNMRLMSKSQARKSMGERFARSSGEWDDAARLPVHHNERIYGGTSKPDQVAQAAFEAGMLKEPSVPELWAVIKTASDRRRGQIKTQARELEALETAADFEETAKSPAEDKLNVPVQDLRIGDAMIIEDQALEVTRINPDGTVLLKDGSRWGIQKVRPDETLWVEQFTESKQPEPAPKPEVPKLGAMEKGTGDLLKGQQEDFALVGERAPDVERIAREKEAAEKRAAEAKAEQEKQQIGFTGMGGAVPSEFEPTGHTATGIRNAIVDQERAKRGLPPAMQPLKRAFGEVWDRIMAKRDKDPLGYDRDLENLTKELRNKPRALTDMEDAMLLHRQIELQNEYAKQTRELAQAYEDGRVQDASEAKLRVDAMSDALLDLYNIGKAAGTETGRGLSARRMIAYEDFTLAKMELEKRAANGGRPLTDSERAEVTAIQQKIEATQKAYDDYVAQTNEKIRKMEVDAALAKVQAEKTPKFDKRILDYAEQVVVKMERAAQPAAARLRERLSRMSVGVDPTILSDAAIVGSAKIARLGLDFARWSDAMVADFSEKIRPWLDEIWTESNKVLESNLRQSPEQVKQAVKSRKYATTEDRRGTWKKEIGNRLAKGKKDQITTLVQKIARSFVEDGVKEREELIDKVHNIMQSIDPEMTRRDTMDAISGYGDYRQLSKDQISIQLRELKGEMQQLAKLEDMAAGQPPLKSGLERRTPSEIERQLIKRVNDAKYKFQVPVEDPNTQLQSALDTLKKTLKNRITDYEKRISEGDYSSRPRRELILDRQAMELKAKNEAVKRRWQAGLRADRLKNRTRVEKIADTIVRWKRGFVLSGFTTLGKLTTAAIQRMTFTPTEEIIGSGLRQLPGFRQVAERAPREGAGFSLDTELKTLGEAFTVGMKESLKVLKDGRGTLDHLFGIKDAYIGELTPEQRSIVDVFGHIHGALKAPVKQAEFRRSVEQRMKWAARHGIDITDDLVKTRIMLDAYKDGMRSIFLQDNKAAGIVNAMERYLEQRPKGGALPVAGKLSASFMRLLLPITKVPANIVAETIQYSGGGLARGTYNMAKAFQKGFETLKPEEADMIMRDFKKGSIGSGFLLAGFLAPQIFGGFYQPGEKRGPRDVKPMSMRTPFGFDIPSWALHNPLLETMQVGATIRRVADSKLRWRDREQQGITNGLVAGAMGLLEEVPFIREMFEFAKTRSANERGAFFGELLKASIVPQGIQQIAAYLDKDTRGEPIKRQPKTVLEHVKVGIPGIREQVPVKRLQRTPRP